MAAKVDLLGVFDLTNSTTAVAPLPGQDDVPTMKGIVVEVTSSSSGPITPDALKAAKRLCPWVAAIGPVVSPVQSEGAGECALPHAHACAHVMLL
jgi:hypothetical protein